MAITQSFNGAAIPTPTWINLCVFWVFEIPLAYAFIAKGLGIGPWVFSPAITIAFSTLAVVSAWIFKQGKWKVRCLITLEIYEPLRQVEKDITAWTASGRRPLSKGE